VVLILLESVPGISKNYHDILLLLEWIITGIFTLEYIVEGENGSFTSIPQSIYWSIVTLTTVGYGDISPVRNSISLS
jgi:voltage-gated potassium channel